MEIAAAVAIINARERVVDIIILVVEMAVAIIDARGTVVEIIIVVVAVAVAAAAPVAVNL